MLAMTFTSATSTGRRWPFRCPLAAWADRETHTVARTGSAELSRWLTEGHDVYADYIGDIALARSPEQLDVR